MCIYWRIIFKCCITDHKKHLERLGFVCKENFLSLKESKYQYSHDYTHLCNFSSALRHLSPGTMAIGNDKILQQSSKAAKIPCFADVFPAGKRMVFFAMLVCCSVTTSKQRPSEPRFTPCMYLSQIHLMNRCWVAQHSTPTSFPPPFQKPGRSCRRLPCGSPSAKADAGCPALFDFWHF